jgi:hypothetical protein
VGQGLAYLRLEGVVFVYAVQLVILSSLEAADPSVAFYIDISVEKIIEVFMDSFFVTGVWEIYLQWFVD